MFTALTKLHIASFLFEIKTYKKYNEYNYIERKIYSQEKGHSKHRSCKFVLFV